MRRNFQIWKHHPSLSLPLVLQGFLSGSVQQRPHPPLGLFHVQPAHAPAELRLQPRTGSSSGSEGRPRPHADLTSGRRHCQRPGGQQGRVKAAAASVSADVCQTLPGSHLIIISRRPVSVKACLLLTSATKIEPMKALDSRFTERSKATPGVTSAISSTAGLAPLDR